jgi:hypothetical protein
MTQANPEQVRQITQEVLARPEFLQTRTWTQVLLDHLARWFHALIDWSSKNPDLSKALIIVLAIVLALLLAHIIYTVTLEFVSVRRPGRSVAGGGPLRALEGVAENWHDAFKLAKSALDSGELYRALWITHRVLLSVLDRTGDIKFVRWKTNSDYLRECRDAGRVCSILSDVTAAYDRVIYAHDEIDGIVAAKLLAQVEALAVEAGR